MRSIFRSTVTAMVALGALALGCGDDSEPGSSTNTPGGSSGSAGAGQAGALMLGGSAGSAGSSTGGSSAGKGGGGSASGAAGSSAGGSSGASSEGGSGGSGIVPQSAGTVSATIDGQALTFDQCRLVRQLADGQYTVDAKLKSGGNQALNFTLTLANGPGTYGCSINLISYSNAEGKISNATANEEACSMTFTELPKAKGEPLKGTFSAMLSRDAETVSVTNGVFDLKASN